MKQACSRVCGASSLSLSFLDVSLYDQIYTGFCLNLLNTDFDLVQSPAVMTFSGPKPSLPK